MSKEPRKVRRIKAPKGVDLARYRGMKSQWDWHWEHHEKNTPKKISIDTDKIPPE